MNKCLKQLILLMTILLSGGAQLYSQAHNVINGLVTDTNNEPLIGANVYIYKTIEGAVTDVNGNFRFETTRTDSVTLVVSYLGFKEYKFQANILNLKDLVIVLQPKETVIGEVIIVASNFNFGQDANKLKSMNSLDVVMTGSSNGDIYAALQSLPGTQKVGENGRLYVRGGESDETQTFVNGMHVLVPYTTNAENTVQRSRFSPFLFKGINLTLGGYSAEYGQALSSVLPMQTTDVSSSDKLGVSFSPFNVNVGGTVSNKRSSWSFNGDYMNMYLYNKIFPDKYNWINPYQKLSGETQYKIEFNPNNILKIYAGYDYTFFKQKVNDSFDPTINKRNLDLNESNIYLNSTYKSYLPKGYVLFLGVASSLVYNKVNDALTPNDLFKNDRNEIHLKSTMSKSFTNNYKLSLGAESYLRNSKKKYNNPLSNSKDLKYNLDYNIYSAFLDNSFKIHKKIYFNFSGRMEYQTNNEKVNFMPRASLSYIPNSHLQLSTIYGIYSQSTKDDILVYNKKGLSQELSDHYILSLSYNKSGLVFRFEPYFKKYRKLPLAIDGNYYSKGYGHSKGIDLFLENETLINNLRTTLSYSFNDSKRLTLDYPEKSTPQYATQHNFNISLRYFIPPIKTYVGVSNLFASGRPYHNPNKTGYMNSKTTPYNSLDVNMTFLVKPNIILYSSLTNILGRNNVFNYKYSTDLDVNNTYSRVPVISSRERFFFIGVFISLNNTKAYEVSNF
ncbi:TonB-dependent receptor plug [Bacteroides coprosuis DSM 18011]|uniref:TonB-dependent receptor plug n=1 Tax=Bacteroides coprosuis DSM 18011 TaxID=679937 RepID=F3ZV35_9BACE|nr:TonB-dependent receptor [Bacteroides coprosuis]EGJ72493.1 TonB-dependent receptor plug [Bacteroides coprosuis DSM 18011]